MAPAGDRAVLVSFDSISATELRAVTDRVRALPGVVSAIAGHSSVYVICEGRPDVSQIEHAVSFSGDLAPLQVAKHEFVVSFREQDGPDLPDLLGRERMTRDEFLTRVAGVTLHARYIGFRAGFAYLDGWPEEWAMPRRPTSRPVPAGSFAVAGSVAGFYPIDTPGGWNLLGRTNAQLSIAPGDEIRIVPTLDPLAFPEKPRSKPLLTLPHVEIVSAPAAIVVPPERAFDVEAASFAARACGASVVIECALVGPRLRATEDCIASWYGADAGLSHQFELSAGDELNPGRIRGGMRGYLAVGKQRGEARQLMRSDRLTIRAMRGPHDIGLTRIECDVTPKLDRVGIRMTPVQPIQDAPADLPSCGMQCGTLQLHPDGSIVAMGPDHPVTGGYLQPMTVISSERWKLAQLMPGDRVVFEAIR